MSRTHTMPTPQQKLDRLEQEIPRKKRELKREVRDSMEAFQQEIASIDRRFWELERELEQIQRNDPPPYYRDFWLRIGPDLHTQWAERQAYVSRVWADDQRVFDCTITETLGDWEARVAAFIDPRTAGDSDGGAGCVVAVLVLACLIAWLLA